MGGMRVRLSLLRNPGPTRLVWRCFAPLLVIGFVFVRAATLAFAARAEPQVDWPIFRGDPALSGVAAGTLPDALELLWTYAAGGAITSSPVVANGAVVFGADDMKVHCVDARTGQGRWTYTTEDIIEAPPLLVDGGVYIGSSDMNVYALDAATGAHRWTFETNDKILGGANYQRTDDGLLIVVGSYDSNLYGLDAATGAKLWAYETDNYVNGTPAIGDGRAVFGGCDAVLHVVSTATGEGLGRVELGPESHVAGSVALAEGRAYFGHYGNQFVCVDLEKREVVWSYDSPRHAFFSSPAIGADRVIFGGRDRQLHCVKKDTGEELWSFATRRKVDGSPILVGDKVVFGSGDGRVFVLAAKDGKELWSYDIGKAVIASPAVVDGRVYIGANDGLLYAFGKASETDKTSENPR